MDAIASLGSISNLALLAALASTRMAVAFLLLPIFAPETVPALVRNAIFLAFGVITVAVQPPIDPTAWTGSQWVTLFAKEALIGIGFGVLLGSVLWAFETAGQFVDTKVGATLAQVVDPLSGHQTSLSGELLARLVNVIFMVAGGFLVFVAVLIESFSIWPLASSSLAIGREGLRVFESAFTHFAVLSLLIAAPALVILYVVDFSLGLMNRFAPQLNLLAISMSLKAVAAVLVWILLLSLLIDTATDRIIEAVRELLPQMRAVTRN